MDVNEDEDDDSCDVEIVTALSDHDSISRVQKLHYSKHASTFSHPECDSHEIPCT